MKHIINQISRNTFAIIGHNEATPLGLSRPQLARLEAFLQTLETTD